MDWFYQSYWKINDIPDTAEQYLSMNQGYQPKDGTLPLNNIKDEVYKDLHNVYFCEDKHNNTLQKAISLQGFHEMSIDIVIASIPAHIKPFKKLAEMKGAKFIFQMGNMFDINFNKVPNLLSSTIPFNNPCNSIFYHQEFDTNIFMPYNLPPERLITSFINVYHENKGFDDYMMMKTITPDFEFRSYGGQCLDGGITTTEEMADIMNKSYLGFMVKYGADGYGHVLHNWFACGKPVIINYEDYKNKLGGKLLIPDETCFVLNIGDNPEEVSKKIQNIPPHKYQWMCQRVYEKFKEVVDFDKEEIAIKAFLDKLN